MKTTTSLMPLADSKNTQKKVYMCFQTIRVFVYFSVISVFLTGSGGSAEERLLDVVLAAAEASDTTDFDAHCEYTVMRKAGMRLPWTEIDRANVSIKVRDEKYSADFKYVKSLEDIMRRVILCDGTAIMSSLFSERIGRTKCEAEVRPVLAGTNGRSAGAVGFPFSVDQICVFVVDTKRVFEKHPNYDALLSLDEAGDILLNVESNGYRTKVRFSKHYGYNPSVFSVAADTGAEPLQVRTATWIKEGELWRVDSVRSVLVPEEYGDEHAYSYQLEFSDWQRTSNTCDACFTLASLDLPAGARVLDRRPDASRPVVYMPVSDSVVTESLDRAVQDLQSAQELSPAPTGGSQSFWWFAAMNAALLIAGGCAWFTTRNRN